MTCTRCKRKFQPTESGACPRCGEPRPATSGVVRTSAILIGSDGDHRVYRSVEDVPAPLRQKLLESTGSLAAGTILIADRKGRQQLARALRKLSASPQHRAPLRLSGRVLRWLGLLLAVLCLGFVWLIFTQRW